MVFRLSMGFGGRLFAECMNCNIVSIKINFFHTADSSRYLCRLILTFTLSNNLRFQALRNILLFDNGVVKICDFGQARYVSCANEYCDLDHDLDTST